MTEILLYTAAPGQHLTEPLFRSRKAQLSAALYRARDILRWRLLGDYRVGYYEAWRLFRSTNRGDHAIRQMVGQTLSALPSMASAIITEVEWGLLSERDVQRLNERGGVFAVTGGGYLFFHDHNEIAQRFDAEIPLIERMTCPRIAYGIGINQLQLNGSLRPLALTALPPRTSDLLRRLTAAFDLIAVRDRTTERLLEPLAPGRVHLTGDPALFLTPPPQAAARKAGRPGPLVGLNFVLHGRYTAATLPTRMRWIVPLLQRLRSEWGCTFRYLLHSDCERIFPCLLRQNGIEVELVDASVEAMIEAYAELDFHICQMLHSSIFSVAAGVPTINVGYDTKNLEFFTLMGIPEFCVEPDAASAETIFARAEKLRCESAAFKAVTSERKQALALENARFVEAAARLLDRQAVPVQGHA